MGSAVPRKGKGSRLGSVSCARKTSVTATMSCGMWAASPAGSLSLTFSATSMPKNL